MNSIITTLSSGGSKLEEDTPASRRREKVRQTILEAAERVFAEEGHEGLSIRRLAEEVDYSPSAIYKYFASKTELIGYLKEAFFMRLVRNIEEAIENRTEEANGASYIRNCTQAYIKTALEKPHHYAAGFTPNPDEAFDNPDLSESEFMAGESPSSVAFQYLCAEIEAGMASGEFRQDLNAHDAAVCLAMSTHGFAMSLIQMPDIFLNRPDGSSIQVDELLDVFADQVVRGLAAS